MVGNNGCPLDGTRRSLPICRRTPKKYCGHLTLVNVALAISFENCRKNQSDRFWNHTSRQALLSRQSATSSACQETCNALRIFAGDEPGRAIVATRLIDLARSSLDASPRGQDLIRGAPRRVTRERAYGAAPSVILTHLSDCSFGSLVPRIWKVGRLGWPTLSAIPGA